jgi:hypothetical protein
MLQYDPAAVTSMTIPLPTRAQILTRFPAEIPSCSECTYATVVDTRKAL